MSDASTGVVGFAPEEIDFTVPTRNARLKWVVVVDEALPPGRAVNAAVCAAAATAPAVAGLLGDDAIDAGGGVHPGLPWAGCSVLAADADALRRIHAKAASSGGCLVAGMPAAAQHTRVYADYLAAMKETAPEDVAYYAVSVVGPRNRVDKIVGRLPLLP
ncbi:DUF2000 domain-containing protein [Bailinhaonella thermotolerans]|uniref:DUF2000 domain-containing protein n=1 Tax=Bailinhaonella thermotolerans TaxID=1070861 RepID=A0A3A4AU18_9ACTN|nr:DUF2000 domain-containing protein [Bailinhaonella thermotolerans]RJL23032.1 DUF2000 domain-containing protein [Bailinhaonella thermotolerans]